MLNADDATAFARIRQRSLQTDPQAFSAYSATDPASNPDFVRARLASSSPENGEFVLGAFGDDLVGVVGVVPTCSGTARLWGFYVLPEQRGRGIGRALTARVVKEVERTSGIRKLRLSVSKSSHAARRIYERAGFHVVDETSSDATVVMERPVGLQR